MTGKTYCTRCKHERGEHADKADGWHCKAKRKDGQSCRCPSFADPNRVVSPPQDYRPRKEDGRDGRAK